MRPLNRRCLICHHALPTCNSIRVFYKQPCMCMTIELDVEYDVTVSGCKGTNDHHIFFVLAYYPIIVRTVSRPNENVPWRRLYIKFYQKSTDVELNTRSWATDIIPNMFWGLDAPLPTLLLYNRLSCPWFNFALLTISTFEFALSTLW